MSTCPTVKVRVEATADNPEGSMIINESDKTDEHVLFDSPVEPVVTPVEPVATKPASKKNATETSGDAPTQPWAK